jgi:uncharacterized protein (UPF0261 family)
MSSPRRIALLVTLDTKAAEAKFLAECVRGRGHEPWIVDLGIAGEVAFEGDTSRAEIAAAAGYSLGALQALPKGDAMTAVTLGGAVILKQMLARDALHGVLGIGGGSGAWLSAQVMQDLPLHFPKLIVTSTFGAPTTDIVMVPSITDVAGLNRILTPILVNAVAAVCGMAEGIDIQVEASRPVLGMSMFGVTTAGGTFVLEVLNEAGYETIVFHANGSGGKTLEELIDRGVFAGVLDWTTSEITDEIVGGRATAGPHRLEAAGRQGIPQVIVPGAIDVVNLGAPERVPTTFAGRTFHMHRPNSTLMRINTEESIRIAESISAKLNAATGPVTVLIPLLGFSSLDAPGNPFENSEADEAFIRTLRSSLRSDIVMKELPYHINDEPFARAAAEELLQLIVSR